LQGGNKLEKKKRAETRREKRNSVSQSMTLGSGNYYSCFACVDFKMFLTAKGGGGQKSKLAKLVTHRLFLLAAVNIFSFLSFQTFADGKKKEKRVNTEGGAGTCVNIQN
jgi:hypothetical protein